MSGSQNALPWQEKNNNQSYFHSRWYNNPIGEVTEWFMVPLSKSGLRLYRSVGSNPTLSAERCWSGLTGTPGERVSGFPRPWVRIPPSPPTTSTRQCPTMMRLLNSSNPTKSANFSVAASPSKSPISRGSDVSVWGLETMLYIAR